MLLQLIKMMYCILFKYLVLFFFSMGQLCLFYALYYIMWCNVSNSDFISLRVLSQ
jgi:hypothetical protein